MSFMHLGYTYAVVLNDHTSAVLPVITTDKAIDVPGPVPTGEGKYARLNKAVYDDCEYPLRCAGPR